MSDSQNLVGDGLEISYLYSCLWKVSIRLRVFKTSKISFMQFFSTKFRCKVCLHYLKDIKNEKMTFSDFHSHG